MEKKNVLTKVLATVGTILVWFPIFAPILISAVLFATERIFRFDYLMPEELFPFALIGSGLVGWAAIRAHAYVKPIAWGIGIAILMLLGGQEFAVVTGLASGETEPVGWMWGLVIASLVIYTLSIMIVGAGGVLLLRDLFKKNLPSTFPPASALPKG